MSEATACVESLYASRRVALVRAAALLLGDAAAAEEVVQDAFLELYRSFGRLRDDEAAAGYLYRTVVNRAHSQLRRRAVALRHTPVRVGPVEPAGDGAISVVERETVLAAVGRLARRQRECVVLRWYLDLSERQIADALGISAGAVKTHLHRGMAALTGQLEELR